MSEKIIGFVELRFLVLKLASYLDFKEMAKNSTWEIIGYLSRRSFDDMQWQKKIRLDSNQKNLKLEL